MVLSWPTDEVNDALQPSWARTRLPKIRDYDPNVERWRDQLEDLMPPHLKRRPDAAVLLDKALWVMGPESGGTPQSGDGGAAWGLFQSHHIPPGSDTTTQINDMWRMVSNNPDKWTDWGEDNAYDYGDGRGPVPFGALGHYPYPGSDPSKKPPGGGVPGGGATEGRGASAERPTGIVGRLLDRDEELATSVMDLVAKARSEREMSTRRALRQIDDGTGISMAPAQGITPPSVGDAGLKKRHIWDKFTDDVGPQSIKPPFTSGAASPAGGVFGRTIASGVDPETGGLAGGKYGPFDTRTGSDYVDAPTDSPRARLEAQRQGQAANRELLGATAMAGAGLAFGPVQWAASQGLAAGVEGLGGGQEAQFVAGALPYGFGGGLVRGGFRQSGTRGAIQAGVERGVMAPADMAIEGGLRATAAQAARQGSAAAVGGLGSAVGYEADEALGLPTLPIVGGGPFNLVLGGAAEGAAYTGINAAEGALAKRGARARMQSGPVTGQDMYRPRVDADIGTGQGGRLTSQDYFDMARQGPIDWLLQDTGRGVRGKLLLENLFDRYVGPRAQLRDTLESRGGEAESPVDVTAPVPAAAATAVPAGAEPPPTLLGRNAQERRYGAVVRARMLETKGPEAVAKLEAGMAKTGMTWADVGDAEQAFATATPSWEQRPDAPDSLASPGGGTLQQQLRDAVEAVRAEREGRGTRAAMEQATEGQVVRVAVRQDAVRPLDPNSTVGSRGGVELTDATGARVLAAGEEPGPGEVLMHHGTGPEGVQGALREGTNLIPDPNDAAVFARATTRLNRGGTAAGVVPEEPRKRGGWKVTGDLAGPEGERIVDDQPGFSRTPEEAQQRQRSREANYEDLRSQRIADRRTGALDRTRGGLQRLRGDQNPVQPEDIAFGGADDVGEASRAGMRADTTEADYLARQSSRPPAGGNPENTRSLAGLIERESADKLWERRRAILEKMDADTVGVNTAANTQWLDIVENALSKKTGAIFNPEVRPTPMESRLSAAINGYELPSGSSGRMPRQMPGANVRAHQRNSLQVLTDDAIRRQIRQAYDQLDTDKTPVNQSTWLARVRDLNAELYERTGGAEGAPPPQGFGNAVIAAGPRQRPRRGEVAGEARQESGRANRIDARRLAEFELEEPPPGEFRSPHADAVPENTGKRTVIVHNDPDLESRVGAVPLTGKPIRGGGIQAGAIKDFPTWLDELENTLTPDEIRKAAAWYSEVPQELDAAFQTGGDPVDIVQSFMVSQVNNSPQGGILNVQRAEDKLGGAIRKNVAGSSKVNEQSIMNALVRGGNLRGISVKISDFIDSLSNKSARTWAKDDPRGGRPFVADVWEGRDVGFIDNVVVAHLQKATGKTAAELGIVPDFKGKGGTFAPSEQQYEVISKWGNDLTDHLNEREFMGRSDWTPAEVQAVSWVKIRKQMGASSATSMGDSISANSRRMTVPAITAKDLSDQGVELTRAELRTATKNYADAVINSVQKAIPQARITKSPDGGLEGVHYDVFSSPETAHEMALAVSHHIEGPVSIYKVGGKKNANHLDIATADGRALSMQQVEALSQAVEGMSKGVSYTDDGVLRVFGTPGGERALARLNAAINEALPDVELVGTPSKGELVTVGEGGTHADALTALSRTRRDAAAALAPSDAQRAAWLDQAVAPFRRGSAGPVSVAPNPAPSGALGAVAGGRRNRAAATVVPEAGEPPTPTATPRRGGVLGTIGRNSRDLLSAPVSAKSTLSPPLLRQGLARLVTNPVAAFKEFATSMKNAFNEQGAVAVDDAIRADPRVALTKGPGAAPGQAGLPGIAAPPGPPSYLDVKGTLLDWRDNAFAGKSLSDLKAMADQAGTKYDNKATVASLRKQLEMDMTPEELAGFGDSTVGRVSNWWARPSNRQAATMMNLMRTNWYKEVSQKMWDAGITDEGAYTELRKTIEQFTQRGSWSQPGGLPIFFSTRAMSGRIQSAWRGVAALTRGVATGETFRPGAQQEAAKAFVSMTTANVAMLGMAYVAADQMGLDPEWEMDGKLPTLKVGSVHWDPWAGLNSPAKFAAGVVMDTAEAAQEGRLADAPQAAVSSFAKRGQKFLRGGLSPVLGTAADTAMGRDFTGQKFNLADNVASGQLLRDWFAPFIVDTTAEIATEGSPAAAAATFLPSALSTSINAYTTTGDVADTKAKEKFGKGYDELSPVERLTVIDAEDKTRYGPKAEAREDFKKRSEKAGYIAEAPEREKAADEETRKSMAKVRQDKNEEVLRANPDLDVERWFHGDKKGGSLKTKAAVDRALELGFEGRIVQFEGSSRNLNASQADKDAWARYGKVLQQVQYDIVNSRENLQTYAQHLYKKPYVELKPTEQANVREKIRDGARQNPKVVAVEAFFGAKRPDADGELTLTAEQLRELQAIWAEFPQAQKLPVKGTKVLQKR
jgi:hypothetical protein